MMTATLGLLPFLVPPQAINLNWLSNYDYSQSARAQLVDYRMATMWLEIRRTDKLPNDLHEGRIIQASVPIENAVYQLEGRVQSFDPATRRLGIALTGKVHRFQQRAHARVAVNLPAASVMLIDGLGKPIRDIMIQLADLSGGGVSFTTTYPIKSAQRVALTLPVAGETPVSATIAITQTSVLSGDAGMSYRAHAKFTQISDEDRQLVISYVKQIQATTRKRRFFLRIAADYLTTARIPSTDDVVETTIVDIGDGGLQMASNATVEKGAIVEVTLPALNGSGRRGEVGTDGGNLEIVLTAKVIACRDDPALSSRYRFRYHAVFIDSDDSQRQQVLAYFFG